MTKMPKNIIVDSGFWIAYLDERDQYHNDAVKEGQFIFRNKIICPFPSLYEFLNTKFTKNKKQLISYEILLKKLNIEYIYDDSYRSNIIESFISYNKKSMYISLVDLIINQIIEDVNVKIDYMITFNKKDFNSTCAKRNIKFLPE